MEVTLTTRQIGDVSILHVAGRVTLGTGSGALGDALRDLANQGHKKVLVNLGEVPYLDSSAIGELVSGVTAVAKQGGQVKILGLTERVKRLLVLTTHYTVFDVHDNEATAISSFS